MKTNKNVFTPKEVAKELGVSEPTVYRALKAGTIPSFRLGAKWLIPVKQFEAKLAGIK